MRNRHYIISFIFVLLNAIGLVVYQNCGHKTNAPQETSIQGKAAIGPIFPEDATATIYNLDQNLNRIPGTQVEFKLIDKYGSYLTASGYSGPWEIEVETHYVDLASNQKSDERVKLRTIIDVDDIKNGRTNINLLTTFVSQRLKSYSRTGQYQSFYDAKAMAEQDLLKSMNLYVDNNGFQYPFFGNLDIADLSKKENALLLAINTLAYQQETEDSENSGDGLEELLDSFNSEEFFGQGESSAIDTPDTKISDLFDFGHLDDVMSDEYKDVLMSNYSSYYSLADNSVDYRDWTKVFIANTRASLPEDAPEDAPEDTTGGDLNDKSLILKSRHLIAKDTPFDRYLDNKHVDNYQIACYYYDSNKGRGNDSPTLMYPSKVYGSHWNYYYAVENEKRSILKKAFSSDIFSLKNKGQVVDGFFVITDPRVTPELIERYCGYAIKRGTTFYPSKSSYKYYELYAMSSSFKWQKFPVLFKPENKLKNKYNKIVIFGDSLSDNGRLIGFTQVMPGYPYFFGRFSNGWNWTDYFKNYTKLPILNFATGGAKSEPTKDVSVSQLLDYIQNTGRNFVTGSAYTQIDRYFDSYLTANSYRNKTQNINSPDDTLFVLWIGANDYIEKFDASGPLRTFINDPNDTGGYLKVAARSAANIKFMVKRLLDRGAKNIAVINLPDFSTSPLVYQNTIHCNNSDQSCVAAAPSTLMSVLRDSVSEHNRLLANDQDLQRYIDEGKVSLVDVNKVFEDVLGDLNKYDIHALHSDSGNTKLDNCYKGGYVDSLLTFTDNRAYDKIVGKLSACTQNSDATKINKGLFWDQVHPTSYMHCQLFWAIYDRFTENTTANLDQTARNEHCNGKQISIPFI